MGYMQQFKKQWDLYVASMDTLGKRLESTRKEYDTLTSTRTNMLKKPLDKIESLSQSGTEIDNTLDNESLEEIEETLS